MNYLSILAGIMAIGFVYVWSNTDVMAVLSDLAYTTNVYFEMFQSIIN